MKSYSLTELNQRSGEVIEAALSGPVELTKRGRRKYVILTAERYDVLTQGASTRRVVHVDDLSEEEANFYLEGLARANQEDENDRVEDIPFSDGTIIRYSYLWALQRARGEVSGRKDRPACVQIVISSRKKPLTMLFPITSLPPTQSRAALEIPAMEARRSGISIPAWVILDEWNEDDLGNSSNLASVKPLGAFSKAFMRRLRETVMEVIRAGHHQRVDRR